MNWKIPRAPDGLMARGLPPLSANTISSAVTSASPLKPAPARILARAASEGFPDGAEAASAGAAGESRAAARSSATVTARIRSRRRPQQLTGWTPGRSLPACTVIPQQSPLLASIDPAIRSDSSVGRQAAARRRTQPDPGEGDQQQEADRRQAAQHPDRGIVVGPDQEAAPERAAAGAEPDEHVSRALEAAPDRRR